MSRGAGITGKVSIDENGDRNADYSLLDLNPETGLFEVRSQVTAYIIRLTKTLSEFSFYLKLQ